MGRIEWMPNKLSAMTMPTGPLRRGVPVGRSGISYDMSSFFVQK
jgi:hypothetical protein